MLGGAPGIFSARWSGRHGDDAANLELLLAQIADVPDEHRAAAFVCAAALALPDGRTACVEGRLHGRGRPGAARDARLRLRPGARAGRRRRTAAELTPAEKNAISHRGLAFRALGPDLREAFGGVRAAPTAAGDAPERDTLEA